MTDLDALPLGKLADLIQQELRRIEASPDAPTKGGDYDTAVYVNPVAQVMVGTAIRIACEDFHIRVPTLCEHLTPAEARSYLTELRAGHTGRWHEVRDLYADGAAPTQLIDQRRQRVSVDQHIAAAEARGLSPAALALGDDCLQRKVAS